MKFRKTGHDSSINRIVIKESKLNGSMENKENNEYKVRSHTFLGTSVYNGEVIGYTYEITFNKSLEHTGRFKGIEDGLNDYCKKEIEEQEQKEKELLLKLQEKYGK